MNWYFGDSAALNFNSGVPNAILTSAMHADAGCAAISNKNGQLQFYTNGTEVWNHKNQLMPNGFGLAGNQMLNQNSIIVPLSDSIYYLFTVVPYDNTSGLKYSVINMNRDNGDGDIVLKNQLIRKGFVQKIAATKHCNEEDTWIILHDIDSSFYCYLLSSQGAFLDTVESKVSSKIRADIGYLKVSPASNLVAIPINNDSLLLEVFRFDNQTGEVFDPIKIYAIDKTVYTYGIEFSPDGNLLYLNTGGKNYNLWQYNLTSLNERQVNASATYLAGGNLFAMQLSPDGKIYVAKRERNFLSAINQPNKLGEECDFQENAVDLQGKISMEGLPNFIASNFLKPGFLYNGTCLGDTTLFYYNQYLNSDSVVWSFGDGNTSNSLKSTQAHVYQESGIYKVKYVAYQCDKVDSVSKTIQIFPYPEAGRFGRKPDGNGPRPHESRGSTIPPGRASRETGRYGPH